MRRFSVLINSSRAEYIHLPPSSYCSPTFVRSFVLTGVEQEASISGVQTATRHSSTKLLLYVSLRKFQTTLMPPHLISPKHCVGTMCVYDKQQEQQKEAKGWHSLLPSCEGATPLTSTRYLLLPTHTHTKHVPMFACWWRREILRPLMDLSPQGQRVYCV